MLSLWANGTSIDVPGPPILTFDEMIAWPPPTASRIGWPRRGGIIAAPCSISPATPTIAAFPYTPPGHERKLAKSRMTRWARPRPPPNSGDRSSTNRSANGLSTTATATARVMGLADEPACVGKDCLFGQTKFAQVHRGTPLLRGANKLLAFR